MLYPVGGPLNRIIPIILAHHDKFDRSGYHPTNGKDIPLDARVISVADAFDSMTSGLSPRETLAPGIAVQKLIAESGQRFDPDVVNAFIRLWRRKELQIVSDESREGTSKL